VLSRQIQETRVDRLQDHSIRQSLLERILRVGTIDFDTAGEEQGDMFRFTGVENPEGVVLQIDRIARQPAGATDLDAIPPPPPPPPPPPGG
jgi:uncharacterized membrane protein YdbT with pleckstrin-like domain